MGKATGKRKEKLVKPEASARGLALVARRYPHLAERLTQGPGPTTSITVDFQGAGPAGAPAAPEASGTSHAARAGVLPYADNGRGEELPASEHKFRELAAEVVLPGFCALPFEAAPFDTGLVSKRGRPLAGVPKNGDLAVVRNEDALRCFAWKLHEQTNGDFLWKQPPAQEQRIDRDVLYVHVDRDGVQKVVQLETPTFTGRTTAGLGAYVNDLAMKSGINCSTYKKRVDLPDGPVNAVYGIIWGGPDPLKLRPVNMAVIPLRAVHANVQLSVAYSWPYWDEHRKAIFERPAVPAAPRNGKRRAPSPAPAALRNGKRPAPALAGAAATPKRRR
eukprot:tig00020553_g10503.t1